MRKAFLIAVVFATVAAHGKEVLQLKRVDLRGEKKRAVLLNSTPSGQMSTRRVSSLQRLFEPTTDSSSASDSLYDVTSSSLGNSKVTGVAIARGGGINSSPRASSTKTSKVINYFRIHRATVFKTLFLFVLVVTPLYYLLPTLLSKIDLNYYLGRLREGINDALGLVESYGRWGKVLYSLVFSLWVAVGLASTPIETAAGAAFGLRSSLLYSGVGKWLGSFLAFSFGRRFLRSRIEERLQGEPVFEVVRKEVESRPLTIALLWRFSCFPELVKNFGLAVMPLRWPYFAVACVIHGFPYTILWSQVGQSAASSMGGGEQSLVMKVVLTSSAIFGLVVSPIIVGAWFNGIRRQVANKVAKKTDKRQMNSV